MLREVGDAVVSERLVDVSRTGARLATKEVLTPGTTERLRVTVPGGAEFTVEGTVIHLRGSGQPGEYHAGLRFEAPQAAAVKALLRAALRAPHQLRAGARLVLAGEAFWSPVGGKVTTPVELLNLGLGGALIGGPNLPPAGAPFILGLSASDSADMVGVPSRLVWSRASGRTLFAGVAFAQQTQPREVVASLLEHSLTTVRPHRKLPVALPAGTRIGRFETGELLPRGRVTEVYRARALTRLPEAGDTTQVALRRFCGEARDVAAWSERFIAAAQIGAELLDVPGVLRVYGATSGRTDCLLATELLEGTSFDRTLAARAGLPQASMLEVIASVLETLEQCHQLSSHEFAHGDLRPSNVLIGPHGEVKLTGFGAAPSQLEPGEVRPPPDRLPYLAPELFREGGDPSTASDVYQCGVMLYEALTGVQPFRPTSPEHLQKLAARGPLPASRLNSQVSETLAALMSEALSLVVKARPTTKQFIERLRIVLACAPLPGQPTGLLERVIERSGKNHRHQPLGSGPDTTDVSLRALAHPSLMVKTRRTELDTGMVLGRYSILGKVAKGGMAIVYLARLDEQAKPLVLKTLPPELNAELESMTLFLNEARVAVMLNHPNIVKLHDFGVDQGVAYMALEYVEGRTLAQVNAVLKERGRRLAPSVAARVIAECCRGLGYAHALADDQGRAMGIVHRDMSSKNILVSYGGDVKVLDFGIAKFRGSSQLTQKGTVRGTIDYIAPEQAREQPITGAVDIWALGVNLYALLAGRRPFSRQGAVATLTAVLSEPHVPLAEAVPETPRELAAIVERALQKEVVDRYRDAAEMGAELERYLVKHPAGPPELAALMDGLFPAAPQSDRDRLARLAWGQEEPPEEVDSKDLIISEAPAQRSTEEVVRHEPLASAPTTQEPAHRPQAAPRPEPMVPWNEPAIAAASVHEDDPTVTSPRPMAAKQSPRRWWIGGGLMLVAAVGAVWVAARSESVESAPDAGTVMALAPAFDSQAVTQDADATAPDSGPEVVVIALSDPDEPTVADSGVVESASALHLGELALSCNVTCEAVLDARPPVSLPERVTSVTPGPHRVRFIARTRWGTSTKVVEFTLKPDEAKFVGMKFGTGTLAVTAPAKSAVFIFGKRVGFTPIKALALIEGTHELLVARAGEGKARYTVTIVAGKPTALSAR